MKERPILMCGEMVRALLDGRKTQTRRIVKPQPWGGPIRAKLWSALKWVWESNSGKIGIFKPSHFNCKYGQPGDHLWVKETFNLCGGKPFYLADGPMHKDWKWKPSIFMPRSASRITLEIVAVRVERVQEITGDDCRAEGLVLSGTRFDHPSIKDEEGYQRSLRFLYADLWDSINGDGSWSSNPFCWVLTFKRL